MDIPYLPVNSYKDFLLIPHLFQQLWCRYARDARVDDKTESVSTLKDNTSTGEETNPAGSSEVILMGTSEGE